MAEFTRRGFIKTTSAIGAAAVAGGAAAGQLFDATEGGSTVRTGPDPESMVVHIKDFKTSQVSLMVGTDEIVYTDKKLVDMLLDAATRHQGA
jgi:hypothetical protein